MRNTEIQKPAAIPHTSILDMIRTVRNDLIKDFLDVRHLTEYLIRSHNIHRPDQVIVEQICVGLKEKLIAPVDQRHYQTLIRQVEETGDASIPGQYRALFYSDLEQVLRRYVH